MLKKQLHALLNKCMSTMTVIGTAIVLMLFASCGGNSKQIGEAIVERDSLPSMETLDVETFISDSGVIRYRIVSDDWFV